MSVWDAGAELVGAWERRGVLHCWAGQHPLSSGAPCDGEAHWQSHILIWLCKYLLQKAIRCNPYPVVERQSRAGGRKERKQQECREEMGDGSHRKLNISTKCTGSLNDSATLHATVWYVDQFLSHIPCSTRGGLRTKQHTLTHSEWPMTPSTAHWIQYSNAYCFSRRSWIQCQKESTMLMRGPKYPELRFRHPNSRWWHFPRTELQHYWFLKARSTTPAFRIITPSWHLWPQSLSENSCFILLVNRKASTATQKAAWTMVGLLNTKYIFGKCVKLKLQL